jgi:hypothetical protein
MHDPDIWWAALLLMDQYGDEAAPRATERLDMLMDEGDSDGVVVWRRILAALKELQRGRRPDETVN